MRPDEYSGLEVLNFQFYASTGWMKDALSNRVLQTELYHMFPGHRVGVLSLSSEVLALFPFRLPLCLLTLLDLNHNRKRGGASIEKPFLGVHTMDHPVNKPLAYGRFEPGTFFVSSIILWANHELTSKASKSVLLRLLPVGPAIITKEH